MDIVKLLSTLVLIANIITLLTGAVLMIGGRLHIRTIMLDLIKKYSLKTILLVSGIATLGSLYFSEIMGFTPCKLCWFQRIFMYPQVILVLIALIKKTNDVFKYILVLSVTGLFIAGYHYILQTFPNPYVPCGDVGYSVSCSVDFFKYFGYITIPWMSFSAFLINVFVSLISCKQRDNRLK